MTYAVSVRVYRAAANEIDATVRASDAAGHTEALHGVLAQAAPPPGSAFTPTYAKASARSL
jgi:hypothetical protein